MPRPQPGIFALGTAAHFHVELTLRPGVGTDDVRRAVAALAPAAPVDQTWLVAGLAPAVMGRLAPEAAPADLHDFAAISGSGGRGAPATQHDLWVWVQGPSPDVVLDRVRDAARTLVPVADVVLEQACFVYRDSRDLTGFVDGTENPEPSEAPEVALVAGGAAAGGSYAMTMRWIHDLAAFGSLTAREQERVIGRTKPDSLELDPLPPDSHVGRVVVEADGEELAIYRRSTPWGAATEAGLFFVAFSADPARFDLMLARMFGTTGDGLHDRLTDFSRPVSGSYWFVPGLGML